MRKPGKIMGGFFIGLMLFAIPLFVSCPFSTVWAAFSNVNIFVQGIVDGGIYFSANPGTYQTIVTGQTTGTNGGYTRVVRLTGSNTDTTTDHVITCQHKTSGGTLLLQWPVSAPHQTGTISPVNLLSSAITGLPIDANGNSYLGLYNADTLACTYATALTNGGIAIGAEYQQF